MIPSILLTSVVFALQDPIPLEGYWAGGFRQPDETVSAVLHITREDSGFTASLSLPERGFRLPATLERKGDKVTWDLAEEGGKPIASFRGELHVESMRGRIKGPEIEGEAELELLRVVPLDDSDRTRYAGRYRLDERTWLEVVRLPRALDEVLAVKIPSKGIQALLFPTSKTEFVAGSGELPLPVQVRLSFQLDGQLDVKTVEIVLGDLTLVATPDRGNEIGTEVALPKLSPGLGVERREVTIEAGDVKLAATLYIPPGTQKPCPAVVQLHGSAPTRRHDQWFFYTSTCLRSGLAVLAYDKRGCGESTGVFRDFTVASSAKLFDQLSSDAAAAHAWLRAQEDIDPDRVGLVGGSQAGWIMPLVAKKTAGVRFILSGCGPSVSAGEEAYHEQLLNQGVPLAEANSLLQEYTGPFGFDPRPLLRSTKTPTLWIFGERDNVIPTEACLVELERVRKEGNLLHDVHVLADANHNYQTSSGDGVLLEPVIVSWLKLRGILPPN